jgi:hypothetical protein
MRFAKAKIFGCVFTALVLVAGAASAENLLVNGDFETGDLTGWEVAGGNASATVVVQAGDNGPAAPGTRNAFMNNQGEAVGLTLKQVTEVGIAIPGAVQYSFDLKLDQADAGGVLFVEIFAEQEGVGIIGGSGLMGPYWPWNEWQTYGGSFEAPVGTSFLTIQIMANTGAAVGTNCVAHVDNVVLDQGTVDAEDSSWSDVKALFR